MHPVQFSSSESVSCEEDNLNKEKLVNSRQESSIEFINFKSSIESSYEASSTSGTALPSNLPSLSNVPKIDQRPKKQLKLFGKRQRDELSDNEVHEIHGKLIKMLAKDLQPISIVENEGFLEYSKVLQPLFKPPNRKKLGNEMLPKFYIDAVTELKNMLNQVTYLSITTDLWSSDSNVGYITVTAHFVFCDKIFARVLATREIAVAHTGENIAGVLKTILNEWSI